MPRTLSLRRAAAALSLPLALAFTNLHAQLPPDFKTEPKEGTPLRDRPYVFSLPLHHEQAAPSPIIYRTMTDQELSGALTSVFRHWTGNDPRLRAFVDPLPAAVSPEIEAQITLGVEGHLRFLRQKGISCALFRAIFNKGVDAQGSIMNPDRLVLGLQISFPSDPQRVTVSNIVLTHHHQGSSITPAWAEQPMKAARSSENKPITLYSVPPTKPEHCQQYGLTPPDAGV